MDGSTRSPEYPSGDPARREDAEGRAVRCREHLERVLASGAFAHAPVQQRFLRFVVEETLERRGDQLKEYVVGTAVFDRGADYDPHQDTTVRVAARRLRQKLHEYSGNEGRDDPVRIVLHAGSYRPDFEMKPPAEATAAAGSPAVPAAAVPAGPGHSGWRARVVPILLGVAAVLAVAAWVVVREWNRPESPTVAVLPFQNATADPDNALVCFGLVEELTTRLARSGGLRVIARTSASQFTADTDIRDAARRLGATAVIEGSVRGEGGRLRITAQLIRAADGAHLWAQTYDRAASDLLGMQEDVAREVAAAVGERLLGRAPAHDAPRASPAAGAVAAYWRGRYYRSLRTAEHRRRSLELFEAAIAADRDFAPAHAAAGEVLSAMAFHAEIPPEEGVARALAASRRAWRWTGGSGRPTPRWAGSRSSTTATGERPSARSGGPSS